MHILKRFGLIIAVCLTVTGCSSWSWDEIMDDLSPQSKDTVKIDGREYPVDENGIASLTQQEVDELEASGNVVRIKYAAPSGSLVLSPDEFTVLMGDSEVFFAQLDGQDPANSSTALVSKGSLKYSFERAAARYGYTSIQWAAHDYHVESPFAVAAPDPEMALFEIVKDYPVYIEFLSDNSIVVSLEK